MKCELEEYIVNGHWWCDATAVMLKSSMAVDRSVLRDVSTLSTLNTVGLSVIRLTQHVDNSGDSLPSTLTEYICKCFVQDIISPAQLQTIFKNAMFPKEHDLRLIGYK